MTTVNLRFAPDILRRLGEELVPHPDLGVMELVRNAYDADAADCTIELDQLGTSGARVVVTDSGDGMTEDDIVGGWLLLGRSPKTEAAYSRNGRRKVGEKGLGRLAALRMGRRVLLITRPKGFPGVEHVLEIDWNAYDAAQSVEEVPLIITSQSTDQPPGTRIEILDLTTNFDERDIQRLARSIILLTGPFQGPADFAVRLEVPQFHKLEKIVHQTYFDEAEYIVKASLDENGQASATLLDWRGELIAEGGHFEVSSAGTDKQGQSSFGYFAPSATFELWTFNLSAESFTLRNSQRKVGEVRQWLKAVGGVHLFHRGLRVHPYGDEGHDWLDMNLRRVRSPELRPSTNTAVGRVSVDDQAQMLTPKTDRMGFIESDSFRELARFGMNVLDWAALERLKLREKRKEEMKARNAARTKNAWVKVEDSIRMLPPAQQRIVREATNELRDAYDEKVQTFESDLALYRTLGTVGTTAAVFAHETKQPVDLIHVASGALARSARRLVPDKFDSELGEKIKTIESAATSLRTYADIPLKLLQRRKRRPKIVNINEAVSDLASIFLPHLHNANIDTELQLTEAGAPVKTTVAAVEAILANLMANAVYAFTHPHKGGVDNRLLVIRTEVVGSLVHLTVLDNGPGIDISRLAIEDIWLPGLTTREDGTGLGLTIVKDVTRDMDGRVYVKAEGELGGAEFTIELPLATDVH